LEISQLVKLQLVEKLVLTDLPIPAVPAAVDYDRYYHALDVNGLPDILLYARRVFG
jgi:hypothetical protein